MVRLLDAAVYFPDPVSARRTPRPSDGPAARFPIRFANARADAEAEARRRDIAGRPGRLCVVFRDGMFQILEPGALRRHEAVLHEAGAADAGASSADMDMESGTWPARVKRKSAIDAAVRAAIDGSWRTAAQIRGAAARRLGFEPSLSTIRDRIRDLERRGGVERRWQPGAAPKPSLEYRRFPGSGLRSHA